MATDLMALGEVARRLDMTATAVRRQVREGKLPSHHDGDADKPFWIRAAIEDVARSREVSDPDHDKRMIMMNWSSVKDVARRFGVSIRTVWRRVKLGLLPQPCYPWPHVPRWRRAEIDRMAEIVFGG